MDAERFVSITGLSLQGPGAQWRIRWNSRKALNRARRAHGNLFAEGRRTRTHFHILTVWESKAALRRHLQEPETRQAVQEFRGMGKLTAIGFVSESVPDWSAAIDMVVAEGRDL